VAELCGNLNFVGDDEVIGQRLRVAPSS